MRDSDVRRAVLEWLAGEHAHEMERTRIVEEMGVWSGSVRIDIAVINGSLSGFELKSDRDTLERLPRQIAIYGRVFDFLCLVVGERHAKEAERLVPDWWSIKIATAHKGGVELSNHPHRLGEPNPAPDPYLVAELLTKDEAIEVLDAFDLAKGWKSKRMRLIHERLAKLPFDELKEQVRSILKRRQRPTACSISPLQCVG